MGCFSKPKTVVQPTATLTPEQRGVLDQLLETVSPQIGQQAKLFPGAFAPSASPLQNQAFDFAGGQLPGIESLFQQGTAPIGTDFFDPVREQASRFFERDVAPSVLNQFAQSGSGSADSGLALRALAEAGADVSTNLGAQLAPLFAGLQESQRSRQLQGTQVPFNLAGQLFNLGAGQRGIEGDLLQGERERFDLSDPLRNPAIGAAAQLAGIPAFENIGVQQGAGLGRSLAGGLLGGIGMAGGIGKFFG